MAVDVIPEHFMSSGTQANKNDAEATAGGVAGVTTIYASMNRAGSAAADFAVPRLPAGQVKDEELISRESSVSTAALSRLGPIAEYKDYKNRSEEYG